MSENKSIEEIAEEHWRWLEPLMRYLYITAFIHGAKHQEDKSGE